MAKLILALQALIAAAIPVVLVGNGLWLLVSPTFVEAQYALPGSPQPIERLRSTDERQLGSSGARAVRPGGAGLQDLEEATLDDGTRALTDRELGHMRDVRDVMTGFFSAWAVALIAAAASVVALRRFEGSRAAVRALARGADVTLGGIVALGCAMLLDFDSLFATFHGIFFAEGSWRFPSDSTLVSLYPETFWMVAGATAAVLVLLQAAIIAAAARRMLRFERPRPTARG